MLPLCTQFLKNDTIQRIYDVQRLAHMDTKESFYQDQMRDEQFWYYWLCPTYELQKIRDRHPTVLLAGGADFYRHTRVPTKFIAKQRCIDRTCGDFCDFDTTGNREIDAFVNVPFRFVTEEVARVHLPLRYFCDQWLTPLVIFDPDKPTAYEHPPGHFMLGGGYLRKDIRDKMHVLKCVKSSLFTIWYYPSSLYQTPRAIDDTTFDFYMAPPESYVRIFILQKGN